MSDLKLPNRSLAAVITEAGIYLTLNITSIIGNGLVCIAAYRNPNLRSTTNLYIIALAVSDLLCATIEMPLASSTLVIGRWDFGDVVCEIQGFVDVFTTYATPATLGLTAVNRYVKIVKTAKHKKYFSPLRSKFGCFAFGIFLRFTFWLVERQIFSVLNSYLALTCAPLVLQIRGFESFIFA